MTEKDTLDVAFYMRLYQRDPVVGCLLYKGAREQGCIEVLPYWEQASITHIEQIKLRTHPCNIALVEVAVSASETI